MNIEEAIKKIRELDLYGSSPAESKKAIIPIVRQIKLDQPKVVVPKFVAEWYEVHKNELYLNLHKLAWELIENLDEDRFVKDDVLNSDFKKWYYRNETSIQTLINMHQFGYEIEQEKLYTVDLPNGQPLVRGINTLYFTQNLAAENARLTEAEIRKDFDWAWRFAEEVNNENI